MGKTETFYINAAKRALARAYEGECHKRFRFIESENGVAEGLYVNEAGAWYFVSLVACTCLGSRSGRSGNLCRHQLALADLSGNLDRFIPDCYPDPTDSSQIRAGVKLRYVSTGITAYVEEVDRANGTLKITTSERVGRLEHFERALELGRVELVA
jgi:hypothetical protein